MKRLLWIVLFGAMITCFAGAQEFEFNFLNSLPVFETNSIGYNSGPQLDLMAASGRKPIIGVPILAGFVNSFFGTWSWMNQDWLGGGITAGIEIGGVLILVIAAQNNNAQGMFQALGGAAVFLGGMIYGFVRGFSQSRKMNSAYTAWTGNPLDHITVAVLPAAEGGLAGNLTFSIAY